MRERESIVQEWLHKAEGDFIATKMLLEPNDEKLYDTVCFHAQQCIEKLLKAVLIHHGQPFPKIHDLKRLAELVNSVLGKECIDLYEMGTLSVLGYECRYPGASAIKEDAQEAFDICSTAREKILEILNIREIY